MKLFSIFGIGADKLIAKGCSVPGKVTGVRKSYLYVVKKPVRLGINDRNTRCSNIITFRYQVEGVTYQGQRLVTPFRHCPQKGETIPVYYDPERPEKYACPAFSPAVPMGW